MLEDDNRYQQMRAALALWIDLTDSQWHQLAAIFQLRAVQEREHITFPDTAVHELYFVCDGLLRFYYLSDEGTESNKAFVAENTFAGSLAAARLNLPVLYGIQALEPTIFLAVEFSDFVALYEQDAVFERLGRKFAEWLLIRKELRMRSLLQQKVTERYLNFVKDHPDLVERIPQYHIASYLGITEVSLSRLKRSLTEAS